MERVIFFNVGWMEHYSGISENVDGGSYVKEHGFGHEIFNFKDIEGKMQGYVQPKGSINLDRLGASKDAKFIEGVLVIFTAKSPAGGTRVVGWYEDAIIYKNEQSSNTIDRKYEGLFFGYYTQVKSQNAVLLNVDERYYFPIVPRGKGGMGQSNVWYADQKNGCKYKDEIVEYINNYKIKKSYEKRLHRQYDVEKRKETEKIAIDATIKEYKSRSFEVISVESENVGWDLEAYINKGKHNEIKLLIEVKGLSGLNISVELSPNERRKMKEYKDKYRLCIVTNCEEKNPIVNIFSYSSELNIWINENGKELKIEEIIRARCFV